MTPPYRTAPRGVKYRCTGCGVRRQGAPGLFACPDCGAALIRIYNGRRKPRPAPKADHDDT